MCVHIFHLSCSRVLPHHFTLNMVFYIVSLRADCENIGAIEASSDASWGITVKDGLSAETRDVFVSSSDSVSYESARGPSTTNFRMTFDESGNKCTVDVVADVSAYADDSGNTPLVGFECDGCDLVACVVGGGYTVRATGEKEWSGVDLSSDWSEYDDVAELPVSVMSASAVVSSVRRKSASPKAKLSAGAGADKAARKAAATDATTVERRGGKGKSSGGSGGRGGR